MLYVEFLSVTLMFINYAIKLALDVREDMSSCLLRTYCNQSAVGCFQK